MGELEIKKSAGNRVDDLILQYIDNESPEQISQRLNGAISPARIRLRANELVSTVDWMTDAQQQKAALLKLRRWLAQLENKHMDNDNAKLRLSYVKTIMDRIDKRQTVIDADMNTYSANVGREMARVYDIALAFMKGALRGEIEPDTWDALATEALTHAQAELMKHVDEVDGKSMTSPS